MPANLKTITLLLSAFAKTPVYMASCRKWSSYSKVSKHGFILLKSTVKNKNTPTILVLSLARCERLPEEVAAACLALSLGEGKMSPHHLLPDSHRLLLLRLGERLVSSRCHQFRDKLQQEQVSEVLKEDRKGNEWLLINHWRNQLFNSISELP